MAQFSWQSQEQDSTQITSPSATRQHPRRQQFYCCHRLWYCCYRCLITEYRAGHRGRQNNASPPKMSTHSNLWNLWICYMSKGNSCCSWNQIANQLTLKWGDGPGVQCNHKSPKKRKKVSQRNRQPRKGGTKRWNIAGLMKEEEWGASQCMWDRPEKLGKTRKHSSLEPPETNTEQSTAWFQPGEIHFRLLTSRTVR